MTCKLLASYVTAGELAEFDPARRLSMLALFAEAVGVAPQQARDNALRGLCAKSLCGLYGRCAVLIPTFGYLQQLSLKSLCGLRVVDSRSCGTPAKITPVSWHL